MKRAISSALLLSILVVPVAGLVGCGEENSVTTQKTIKTPEGTTTVTDKSSVKTTDPAVKTEPK